ncbi:MAG: AAA family ATPase [Halobacteriales archaeon]|nr:AAA family ATPase [Halobacteriales archaeon]
MTLSLTVAAIDNPDTDREHALLDQTTLDRLGIESGDAIELVGRRRTVVAVYASGRDGPTGTIQLDETALRNADTEVDDTVEVAPVSTRPATTVTVAPTQPLQVSGGEAALRTALDGCPVARGDTVRTSLLGGSLTLTFVIVDIEPEGPVRVTDRTDLVVRDDPVSATGVRERRSIRPTVAIDDVGGLDDELAELRETLLLPLEHPELADRLGRESPTGVLLHGPSGTGKTLLARALGTETDVTFIPVASPTIAGLSTGDREERLESIVQDATQQTPAIVFFDDIDALAPSRDDATGRDRRGTARLLPTIDELAATDGVALLATTNRLDAIDEGLRRGDRFGYELEIGVPDRDDRRAILGVRTRDMSLASAVDLDRLADRTHGFVGADLEALCRRAAVSAMRRVHDRLDLDDDPIPDEVLATIEIEPTDFEAALQAVEPSAMRSVTVEVPAVGYDDIGGLTAAKRELIRAVEWPLAYPDLFDRLNTDPPAGLLLYGPPGTGKTLLARAVANATDANFISINGPEILDKYVGESERSVREVFDRARQHAPAVIFFDEVDAITPQRGNDVGSRAAERVVSQLLTEIDGLESLDDVVVIAATNRPDMIDPALLRPGRLEKAIEVPLPDRDAREEIFRIHSRDIPRSEIEFAGLAERTDGYSGSDIEAIVREASMLALEDYLADQENPQSAQRRLQVTARHFRQALEAVSPSVTEDRREYYDDLADQLGR